MNELLLAACVSLAAAVVPRTEPGVPAACNDTQPLSATASVTMHAPDRDAWLGPDKFRHLWMSYAVTAAGFSGVYALGGETDAALTVGVATGAAAGIAKEIYDRHDYGLFSVRDLVADALGITAAYFLLREVR